MNKVVASVVLGLSLASTGVAQASSEQGQQLTECKEQLTAIYGEETRVRISGKAAVSESTLKFRVYPRGERLLRVSCTRAETGAVSLMDQYGIALVVPQQNDETLMALPPALTAEPSEWAVNLRGPQ